MKIWISITIPINEYRVINSAIMKFMKDEEVAKTGKPSTGC